MKRVLSLIFVWGALFGLHQVTHAQIHFTAKLDGAQEVPPVTTTATGTGTFTLNSTGTELTYHITFAGLSGSLTASHFHNAAVGVGGGVVRNISFNGNTASGSWKSTDATQPLSPTLVNELLAGRIYVNLHTAANPGGEIRGQVLVDYGIGFTAKLDGAQEVPPVTTTATGTGSFRLKTSNSGTVMELEYHITFAGLSGSLTASHFHNAAVGVGGGVVRNISFNGNTASGSWKSSDASQPLTSDLVRELLAGRIYVNLHTAANPGGEIRGQVLVTTGISFTAKLDGAQEVPPVTTTATGTGAFTLNNEGTELTYHITYAGLSGPLTVSHFHNAAVGVGGGVVRNVSFNGNTAAGSWKSTDVTQPLSPTLVNELLDGKIYVNLHTAANPGGEIRGQVLVDYGIGFTAKLDGAQEVPPVTTTATGTGAFTLNNEGTELTYHITYAGLSGPLTASHFHNAAVGVGGGVVRNISFNGNTASGSWKSSDASQPLTSDLVQELLAGRIYVNLHTAANPGGEIRGQLKSGADLTTAVKEKPGAVAVSFKLEQNYPNPFNPATTIKFELAKPARVSLKIYSLLGELVATLIDNELKAQGTHTITFEARSLTSGVYFYKLESDAGFVGTRKLLLLQ